MRSERDIGLSCSSIRRAMFSTIVRRVLLDCTFKEAAGSLASPPPATPSISGPRKRGSTAPISPATPRSGSRIHLIPRRRICRRSGSVTSWRRSMRKAIPAARWSPDRQIAWCQVIDGSYYGAFSPIRSTSPRSVRAMCPGATTSTDQSQRPAGSSPTGTIGSAASIRVADCPTESFRA